MIEVSVPTPARPYGYDSFTDLTPVPVERFDDTSSGLTVVFAADVSAAVAAAVVDRLGSRDDDDQSRRAALRAARAAGATNLTEMHVAYTLGDPMPEAVT